MFKNLVQITKSETHHITSHPKCKDNISIKYYPSGNFIDIKLYPWVVEVLAEIRKVPVKDIVPVDMDSVL